MKTYSILLAAVSLLSFQAYGMNPMIHHKVVVDELGQFHYLQDGKDHRVDRTWVDPLLKEIKTQEQADAFNKACWIRAVKMSDDNYKLVALGRGPGGGAIGVTVGVVVGKFTTYAVCYGALAAVTAGVTAICPPAGGTFALAAGATCAPLIEGLSTAMGIACGLAGGIITGPI